MGYVNIIPLPMAAKESVRSKYYLAASAK